MPKSWSFRASMATLTWRLYRREHRRPRMAAGAGAWRRLAAGGLPEFGLRLRSGRRVDVDVAIEVEIQLLEDRHQRLDVIVARLACRRQREVALEQDLLLRDIGDQQAVRMGHRPDVVQLHPPRAVRVDLLVAEGFDLGLLRVLRERVVEQRSRRVERALEELFAVLLGDDR